MELVAILMVAVVFSVWIVGAIRLFRLGRPVLGTVAIVVPFLGVLVSVYGLVVRAPEAGQLT